MVGTRPGASQVFPGFKPVNAVDKGRSAAVYADLEYDVTENGCLTVPFVTRIILILVYKL
jgi:hypothetical protein